MTYLPIIICGLLGMGITLLVIPLTLMICRRQARFQRAADLHHTHKGPVPRFGGLALAIAFVGVEVFIATGYGHGLAQAPGRLVMELTSLAMFGLGFWDDLRPLGARRKLLFQVLIATVVCCYGIGIQEFKVPFTGKIIDLEGWGAVITVVWLVGMVNLINLVDGVDGLAGGICLMLMVLLGYVGHHSGSVELVVAGTAGALMGFLWFNFPPARIYMGDGGAYFLGFQIGLFSIASSQKGTIVAALVAPLFVLALPIVDMALAILRRGLRGLPVFRPDRRHIHHRLLNMGLSRRKVVLWLYGVTMVFLVMGFAAFWSRGQLVPILLGLSVLILLLCAGKLSFSREWFAVGRVLGNSLGMRQEIQYALCLTRWLALEGNRQNSVEGLWPEMVLAAQRLGFSAVTLTLEDGPRVWDGTVGDGPIHSACFELLGGRGGVLELKAPATTEEAALKTGEVAPFDISSEAKLFEIFSELLAEGWLKATKRWTKGNELPLRFSSNAAASRHRLRASRTPALGDLVVGRPGTPVIKAGSSPRP